MILQRQAQSPQIVQARQIGEVEAKKGVEERTEREDEMLKIDGILPAAVAISKRKVGGGGKREKKSGKMAQPEAEKAEPKMAGEANSQLSPRPESSEMAQKIITPKDRIEREMKSALDIALDKNRPGLVVSAVLEKRQNEQFTESLMQVDERKLSALMNELDARIRDSQLERLRLLGQMVQEHDLNRKRLIRAKLRKLQIHIAFYGKTRGMIGRLLGGFFGKLAGLLKR